MISPCGPLPQIIAAFRGRARIHPAHHVVPHRAHNVVHAVRHVRALVASGCRVVPLATGIIAGVLPPASSFQHPPIPPAAIRSEVPPAASVGDSGAAPAFPPTVSATAAPPGAGSAASPQDPFLVTVPPTNAELPPGDGPLIETVLPDTGWPGTLPPGRGWQVPDGPPVLSQPVTTVPVPEPSSAFVLGAGLCSLIMLGCRRRRSTHPG